MSSKIVFITSYPPRECGIATYSRDLIHALSAVHVPFDAAVCALESDSGRQLYSAEVCYTLRAGSLNDYADMAAEINHNHTIHGVFVQHEFGLFGGDYGDNLLLLLYHLSKPVVITFHTVLPAPNDQLRKTVCAINGAVDKIVVMTNHSVDILVEYYGIQREKIAVIPHGIHGIPVAAIDKQQLRRQYGLSQNVRILTTFGFLSRGKSIETALQALPAVIDRFPDTLYLIIGETHPEIVKREGEEYRDSLKSMVNELGLGNHVRFIDRYVPTRELLEYLALSDLYLFTSKDPNQAVSGTFAYALSCGCPVVSTPIPHAKEVLADDLGILVGFERPEQFASAITELFAAPQRLLRMSRRALRVMASSTWEEVAEAHRKIFSEMNMLSIEPYVESVFEREKSLSDGVDKKKGLSAAIAQ